ncbi:toxin glutamine deamidase domain-containing protein [Micromonospora sp. WMMD1082]|uniref:toxin glutamine deamidase domain-containing protein n=1 Tax=Micromonospora sp. WMMD1082 TaxID=3016104 RepID=UPI002415DB6D|nr:toxin glutamine deamidase domain-containing protein [Micromonospora sp. WMMD1082]MDG4794488.1 toxin glutamine deamidase domain-containing protein [Micromonospora sp. WMMD1082]
MAVPNPRNSFGEYTWVWDAICWVSAGEAWPSGDEDRMRDLADAWQALADTISETLGQADPAVMKILQSWGGGAGEAFGGLWNQIGVDPNTGLPLIQEIAAAYAAGCDQAALEIEYAKLTVLIAVIITVIAVFVALLMAWLGGVSAGAIPGILAGGRQAVTIAFRRLIAQMGRQLLTRAGARAALRVAGTRLGQMVTSQGFRRGLTRLGLELLEEIGEELIIDVGAQAYQMNSGERRSWDTRRTVTAGVGGAYGAVLGTGMSWAGRRAAPRMPFSFSPSQLSFRGSGMVRWGSTSLASGMQNAIISPAASVLANGSVNGQWAMPGADAFLGGFASGAGRTGATLVGSASGNVAAKVTNIVIDRIGGISVTPGAGVGAGGVDPSLGVGGANGLGGLGDLGGTNGAGAGSTGGSSTSGAGSTGGSTSGAGSTGAGSGTGSTSGGSTGASVGGSGADGAGSSSGAGGTSGAGNVDTGAATTQNGATTVPDSGAGSISLASPAADATVAPTTDATAAPAVDGAPTGDTATADGSSRVDGSPGTVAGVPADVAATAPGGVPTEGTTVEGGATDTTGRNATPDSQGTPVAASPDTASPDTASPETGSPATGSPGIGSPATGSPDTASPGADRTTTGSTDQTGAGPVAGPQPDATTTTPTPGDGSTGPGRTLTDTPTSDFADPGPVADQAGSVTVDTPPAVLPGVPPVTPVAAPPAAPVVTPPGNVTPTGTPVPASATGPSATTGPAVASTPNAATPTTTGTPPAGTNTQSTTGNTATQPAPGRTTPAGPVVDPAAANSAGSISLAPTTGPTSTDPTQPAGPSQQVEPTQDQPATPAPAVPAQTAGIEPTAASPDRTPAADTDPNPDRTDPGQRTTADGPVVVPVPASSGTLHGGPPAPSVDTGPVDPQTLKRSEGPTGRGTHSWHLDPTSVDGDPTGPDAERAVIEASRTLAETVRTEVKAGTISKGKQPGMAGALLMPNGDITTHTSMTADKSTNPATQPAVHPLAQAALDRAAAALGTSKGGGHGKCAEVALVSDQLYLLEQQWRDAGEPGNFEQYALNAFDSAKIVTHQVATARSGGVTYELGHYRPPCRSCAHFLPQFNIEPITDPARDVAAYQPSVPGVVGNGPSLSDSRPYGHLDGLVPPDQADQDALDSAVPRDPGTGRPTVHPDPRSGSWAGLLNDGGPTVPGRSTNCADVGLSVLSTWYGRPDVAAPTVPSSEVERGSTARQEQALRSTFGHHGSGAPALDAVAEALRAAGPGAAALVIGQWPGDSGRAHTWNAVNHNGTIIWVDGQRGLVSDVDPLYAGEVDGVWSIVLDAEGDPVRPVSTGDTTTAPVPPASTADVPTATQPTGRDQDAGPAGRPGADADTTGSDVTPGDSNRERNPDPNSESDPVADAEANPDPAAWPDMRGWPMPDTRQFGPDQLAPLEDPRYQDDVADSLRTPDGYETFADPSTHPYGQLINDGGPDQPGRADNCVDNVLAALASFNGDPQVSHPRWPDRLDDGSLDTELGELDGFGRIESWIGGEWTGDNDALPGTPAERSAALADRYEQLYQRVLAAGPGSAAVVAVDWLGFDESTGDPLVDADGHTQGAGQHVFLLVYPQDADGPVWWDPQFGSTTTDSVPGDYVGLTHNLWSMEVQPGHADEQGGSPAVDDQAARDGQPGSGLPVRVRLGSPGDALPAAADAGPAAGPGSVHHRPDGGGDRASQPAATTDHEAVRGGPAGGPDHRPSGLADTGSDGLSGASPDGDPAARPYLDGLPETDQATLLDALTGARVDADQILADLHGVNAEVNARLGLTGEDALTTLGEQHRVKGAESLARKFRTELEPLGYDIGSALDTVNDVVRFSVRGPESEAYGPAVDTILSSLEAQGYQVTDLKNFWHDGNRFFGLNCTLTSPSGRTFELQFPTATSYAIGSQTHAPYEVMRDPAQSPAGRVHAFLDILAINKANGIAASMPGGMDTSRFDPPKDTSFAKWMSSPRQASMRESYLDWLGQQGRTFADMLAARGLAVSDLPGLDLDLMGGVHGAADVRLLPPPETGRSGRPTGQPDRGGGQHRADPGGDLGPVDGGLGVPPGRGGGDPVGEPGTPRDPAGGPGDGGTPGGALRDGAVADGGRTDGDLPLGGLTADIGETGTRAGDPSGAGPASPDANPAGPSSVPLGTDHGLPQTRRLGPGELAPLEDPSYQWDVEQSLRTPEGYAVFADPSTHPYGTLVNDGGPSQSGRSNNCLDCSLSALSSFYGDPRVSFPRWPDVRPDGSIETVTGEASGLDRAEEWLGADWSGGSDGLPTTPAERAAAVAEQYAQLHQRVAEAGPGSAALVVAEWVKRDRHTGELLLDGGNVQIQDSHALVLVYPEGAEGPVWWDPQRGMTWPQPPAAYLSQTYALWSMVIPVEGVSDDGGRGAGADQAPTGHGERDRAASVRVRLAGEGAAVATGTGGGQAAGPRELHHRPDGSDHSTDESAGTAADHGVHAGPPGGPDDGSAGLADGGPDGLTYDGAGPSLPEGRRFGPGELAPLEDSRFQDDLAASLYAPEGYAVFADPSTHPYGQLVNDGGPDQPGRGNNCVDCSLAALASFHGDPQVSVPRWADRFDDGSIDRISGERGGLERAEAWIGGAWIGGPGNLPGDLSARTDAVAAQYAELYQRVADAGPGASALVVADWLFLDDAGNVLLDDAGRPEIDGSHAFVIVFPADADAPVWWDPQTGTTSTDMPAADVRETHALWAMMMPDGEGRVDRGRGADADQPTAADRESDRASGVRVWLAGPGETLGAGPGLGDTRGPGELHHRPVGSDHGPLQPAAPTGDGGVRPGATRGPDQGSTGLARAGTDGLTDPGGPPAPPGPASATTAADGPDLRQAAAGTTFGGALLDADPARTAAAVQTALTSGPLPDGASVDPATATVTLTTPDGPYQVRIELSDPPADTPVAPVATIQYTADGAVVQVSTGAHPDHVRRAVAATLAEADTIAQQRADGIRFDATTALTEGARPEGDGTRVLTARDIGHLAELRVVLADSATVADPAQAAQLRAEALSLLVASGLLEQDPTHAVHGLGGNVPIVGPVAAQARLDLIRAHLGPVAAQVETLIGLAHTDGQQLVADLRAAQSAIRAEARAWAQQATALRNDADLALTGRVDAELDTAPDHVFGRLVIGGGWAATADFVTMGAAADTGSGLPPVLCVSQGHDPWAERQALLMGQIPAELELPGLPFQPADLAEEGTQFTPSDVFADAVGAARALSGMPTYQGTATAITPRPVDAVGWPDGANFRVTVGGRDFFTASVDIASGPGPSRVPSVPATTTGHYVDPTTGYRVDRSGPTPVFHAPDGSTVDPDTLPPAVRAVLGGSGTGLSDLPLLADLAGRPTDPLVVDPISGFAVDPSTGQVFDPDGGPVDPSALPDEVAARLGHSPDGSFGDPRPAAPSVDFGGQNLADAYRPGDRVLVFGAGASGAWDIEQAVASPAASVDWSARAVDPPPDQLTGDPARDAEARIRHSFGGGYNRRNTLPEIGAYSATVQGQVDQSLREIVSLRHTVDGGFLVEFTDGSRQAYDRVVLSIGQAADFPGGVANLLSGVGLEPLEGPPAVENSETDVLGLRDGSGQLRVLGAASVAPGVVAATATPAAVRALLVAQAAALPDDSRGIQPSIRFHAQRITEANRPGVAPTGGRSTAPAPRPDPDGSDVDVPGRTLPGPLDVQPGQRPVPVDESLPERGRFDPDRPAVDVLAEAVRQDLDPVAVELDVTQAGQVPAGGEGLRPLGADVAAGQSKPAQPAQARRPGEVSDTAITDRAPAQVQPDQALEQGRRGDLGGVPDSAGQHQVPDGNRPPDLDPVVEEGGGAHRDRFDESTPHPPLVDQVLDRTGEPGTELAPEPQASRGTATVDVEADQLGVLGVGGLDGVGVSSAQVEVVGVGEDGGVDLGGRGHDGSVSTAGSITASAVPGSTFHGLGRPAADPAAVLDVARSALPQVAPYAQVDAVVPTGVDRFEIRSAGQYPLTVRLTTGPLTDAVVAQSTRNPDGTFTVTVSDRAADQVVARALAHEVAELVALHESGRPLVGPLDPGVDHGPIDPAGLTAHDRGRLAEIRLLAAAYAGADPATRLAVRAEIDALADHLGLRVGDPDIRARWALLPRDVLAHLMQLSAPTITPEAVSSVLAGAATLTEVERIRMIDYRSRLAPDFQVPAQAELDARLRELAAGAEHAQSSMPRMPAFAGQIVALPTKQLDRIRVVDPQLADRLAAEGIYVDLTGRYDLRPYMATGVPAIDLGAARPAFHLTTEAGRQSQLHEDRQRSRAALRGLPGGQGVTLLTDHDFHYQGTARWMGLVPDVLTEALRGITPAPPPPAGRVETASSQGPSGDTRVVADRVTLPPDAPNKPGPAYGPALDARTGQPPPLFDGPPKREDVQQGALGDCGMIAVIGSVAGHLPDTVARMFQPNPDGSVDVLLHEASGPGQTVTPTGRHLRVTVWPDVPLHPHSNGRSAYADQSVVGTAWASLLEKAIAAIDRTWAQQRHNQWQQQWTARPGVDAAQAAPLGYARLGNGSRRLVQAELLTQLTGLPTGVSQLDPTPGREADAEARLAALLAAGSPLITGTRPADAYSSYPGGKPPHGLYAGHAYEIVSVANGQVQLRNPWNSSHPSPMPVRAFLDLMSPWYAHVELARSTVAALPGSEFHGQGRPVADATAVADRARTVLPALAEPIGADQVVTVAPDTVEVRSAGLEPLRIRVTAGSLADGVVAQTVRNLGGTFTLTISDRAADGTIDRAVAHEAAELLARHETGEATVGLFDQGVADGPIDPAGLTARDRGRLAELRLMAAGYAQADAPARLAMRVEIDALVDRLGLRWGTPEAAARLAVLPGDVWNHVMRLSLPIITPDAVAGVLAHSPTQTAVERFRAIDYRSRLAPDFQPPPAAALDATLRELAVHGERSQSSLPRMPALAGQVIGVPPALLDPIRQVDPRLADRIAAEGIYVDLTGRFDLRPYTLDGAPEFPLTGSAPAFDLSTEAGRKALLSEDRSRVGATFRVTYGSNPAAMAVLSTHTFHYVTDARLMALVPNALTDALRAMLPPEPAVEVEVEPTETLGEIAVVADRVTLPAPNPKRPVEYGSPRDARTGQPAPLFDGPPRREQVRQGMLGDCGMLASMAAVAGHRPDALARLFQPNPDGTVDVLLHESTVLGDAMTPTGRRLRITVHPDVPLRSVAHGQTAYADQHLNGTAWASLLEKALAAVDRTWSGQRHEQWQTNWRAWHSEDNPLRSAPTGYARMHVGSTPQMQAELLTQLTGSPSRMSVFDGRPGQEAAVQAQLAALLASGSPVITGTRPERTYPQAIRKQLPFGLVAGHAYEVIAVADGQVWLRNPWNRDHPDPMPVRDFLDLTSGAYAHLDSADPAVAAHAVVVPGRSTAPDPSPVFPSPLMPSVPEPRRPEASVGATARPRRHSLGRTYLDDERATIGYHALLGPDGTVNGLLVVVSSEQGQRSAHWTSGGAPGEGGSVPIMRVEAERIARELLGFTLPPEPALYEMVDG